MNNNIVELPTHFRTHEYVEPWVEPILFAQTLSLPVVSAALLPEPLATFAKALSVATETDESMSVMVVFGVISTCFARQVVISPKVGWQEPINLYTLIALPPANHKSLVIRQCCAPLFEWEQQERIQMEVAVKRRQADIETEKRIVQQMRFQASKCTDLNEQRRLISEIADREANLPKPLYLPKLFANDCTPESLLANVAEQAGRFAIISDEGGVFDTLGGLYNDGMANIDIVLKGIDGGQIRLLRKTGSCDIEPYLTFVLCVQPQVLQNLATKNVFKGRGLLERFLYVIPHSRLGFRSHEAPGIEDAIKQAYNIHIHGLLEQGKRLAAHSQPYLLGLSEEAKRLWQDFQKTTEKQLQPNGELSICIGWGGKISGFALRIAGLLTMSHSQQLSQFISAEIMHNALQIANALKQHAIAAFSLMGVDTASHDAHALLQLIQHKALTRFTRTEINRLVKQRTLGRADRLNRALTELIERQILRVFRDYRTQKPTDVFTVNPAVIKVPGL